MSAKTLEELEKNVVRAAMGWHARQPFALYEWLEHPAALVLNLQRIDNACAKLHAQRNVRKRLLVIPAPAAPDVESMVKRLNNLQAYLEKCLTSPTKTCEEAATLLVRLGQKSHHFTVDLKQFFAPANRMSIAELKAIYGRGGTEFWFVKDPSDKETGRHYFHDSEIVDLKFTSEFYVDLPARM